MNRLIVSGSPRARGRSAGLAESLRFALEEEFPHDQVQLVLLSDVHIAPCTGCEACAANIGRDQLYCIIADDMVRVRRLLNECDELYLVSPVYFAGAPAQLKAFFDRMQPYYHANWRAKPKRPAHLHVVGEGGDPHGFAPLVGVTRSALSVAGFALDEVHDWVGNIAPDGALPTGVDPLHGGRVHPASAYVCAGPETSLSGRPGETAPLSSRPSEASGEIPCGASELCPEA